MAEIPGPKNTVVEAIYSTLEDTEPQHRTYLGGSTIGHDCERYLWYTFRWAYAPQPASGRRVRLFDTGHREEERILKSLRQAKIKVSGEQKRFTDIGWHFCGHIDGIVLGIPEAPKTDHLLEIKTHNDKSYAALWINGVQKSKPQHYAQMQVYMHYFDLDRALYIAVNKNDDSLYSERIKYDKKAADQLVRRAERVVKTYTAPPKLHADPNAREAFVCGWCPAKAVCHEGAWAERNCRTCLHVTPLVTAGDKSGNSGKWHCALWDKHLTPPEQRAGCLQHLFLPSLVPGEQIDAKEDASELTVCVSYRLNDGTDWVDGVEREDVVS